VTVAGCSVAPYAFSYQYDAAGNPYTSTTGVTNPGAIPGAPAGINLTYAYDGVGRLTTLTSNWDDVTHPAQLFAPTGTVNQYGPAGLVSAWLGVSGTTQQPAFTQQRTYDNRMQVLSETDQSNQQFTTPLTPSNGSISVVGTEQQYNLPATAGTATITLQGGDGGSRIICIRGVCSGGGPDSGTFTISLTSLDGATTFSAVVDYDGEDDSTLASELAAALAAPDASGNNPMVSGTVSGGGVAGSVVLTLTSLVTGSASDYVMNVNVSDQDDYPYFASGSALTGGVDGGLTPDAGTILVTVNGVSMSLPWQAGSNAPSIASQIAQQLEVASFLTVNYSSGETVGLTSTQPGSSTDWPITCSATDAYGQPVSFSVNCNGMSAGTNSAAATYQYSIPADGGYAANGSLLSVTDTVMGTWTYSYDSLNRLKTAQAVPNTQTGFAPYGAALLGWGYDSFGNYLGETLSGSTSFAMPQVSYTYAGHSYQNGALSGVVNNRIDGANYDAAGNVITDIAGNSYTYDAENRVLTAAGVTYMYDAEGNRVGKLSGAGLTEQYLLGLGGEQVTELDGSGNWQRTHVYGAGKELAKYDQNGVHFDFTDWLGTRRMQGGATGSLEETCRSLPYGDSLQCFGPDGLPNSDLSGHHFTGKERDTESGLDYFGKRYYASAMGRWTSPDPGKLTSAHLANPQKWNKYNYVLNNPLTMIDPDGQVEVTVVYRAFIPMPSVFGFRGDNRSFSTDPKASSRVTVTMRIETDPTKNGGHPLLGSSYDVGTTHFNLTGSEKKSDGPVLPSVTPSQDSNGNVTLNVNMNMRDPYQPVGQGAASNVNISVNEAATSVEVQGTVSGAPSFEANFTPAGAPTTNLPVQSSPEKTGPFLEGLQQTNQVDKKTDLKQAPQ